MVAVDNSPVGAVDHDRGPLSIQLSESADVISVEAPGPWARSRDDPLERDVLRWSFHRTQRRRLGERNFASCDRHGDPLIQTLVDSNVGRLFAAGVQRQGDSGYPRGTSTLNATLDVASGQFIAETTDPHRARELCRFSNLITCCFSKHLDIHLGDKMSTHMTTDSRGWLGR
jgi:hypothetical protein